MRGRNKLIVCDKTPLKKLKLYFGKILSHSYYRTLDKKAKGGFTPALLEAEKRKEVTSVTLEDLYQ